jgi:predicted esterase
LFGFSNGAYFATNLAFRDAFGAAPVFTGVAAFAGGSGSKYQRLLAERTKRRVPVFVGYGSTDPDHLRQEQMVSLLRDVRWPHQVLAAKVGHSVTDAQIRAALQYLGHPVATRR